MAKKADRERKRAEKKSARQSAKAEKVKARRDNAAARRQDKEDRIAARADKKTRAIEARKAPALKRAEAKMALAEQGIDTSFGAQAGNVLKGLGSAVSSVLGGGNGGSDNDEYPQGSQIYQQNQGSFIEPDFVAPKASSTPIEKDNSSSLPLDNLEFNSKKIPDVEVLEQRFGKLGILDNLLVFFKIKKDSRA